VSNAKTTADVNHHQANRHVTINVTNRWLKGLNGRAVKTNGVPRGRAWAAAYKTAGHESFLK